jgi:TetR/AcrR family transcriptional regulator, transcriptional repressor for nem operon
MDAMATAASRHRQQKGDPRARTPRRDGETASRILDVAERMIQVRGFNAVSYADVAAELDLTKASLHYHFASKGALGQALIDRYALRFAELLGGIDGAGGSAPDKLRAYARLYSDVLRGRRMCLCGMLAAEHETLPAQIGEAVVAFFDMNEAWLTGVLEQGRADGSLRFAGSARDNARMLIGGLEGAMLVARPYGDARRFQATARRLLAGLSPQRRGA